jgi:transposase-like protein
MKTPTTEPMDTSKQFCPNVTCSARGKTGEGTITIHDKQRRRYRCKVCKKTFSERRGTMFEGLRKPMDVVIIVVTLLSYGCPVQAIVQAFSLDERTVAAWRDRAGQHCQHLHEAIIEQGKLDLVHVQADEIRVKGRAMIAWMGLAMIVSTRLWVAGALSSEPGQGVGRCVAHAGPPNSPKAAPSAGLDRRLERVSQQHSARVSRKGQAHARPRQSVRGRVWPDLQIGTVIKHTEKKRVVEITRTMAHGCLERAEHLLQLSRGGEVLNTAFIERFNGTFRERLASLTRKSRHAASRLQALHTGMYLIGCTYNFCVIHQERSKEKHWGQPCTPAMASELTDHVWSFGELLRYKVAPAPWIEPKRRERRPKQAGLPVAPTKGQSRPSSSRPLVRLRKGVLCSTTV